MLELLNLDVIPRVEVLEKATPTVFLDIQQLKHEIKVNQDHIIKLYQCVEQIPDDEIVSVLFRAQKLVL